MKIEYFWATMLFVVIGYLIGSISWSIIISKFFIKEDIRTRGSKNAGATNTLRNYGVKLGLSVFILDFLKVIVIIVIAYCVKIYAKGIWSGILLQAVGFAAVIGHIYPLYFKFKGGKGVSSLFGFIITINWLLAIIAIAIFIFIVFKTKKVSLSSIITPLILIILQIAFVFIPYMNQLWFNPIMQEPAWWVNTIFLFLIWLLIVYKHKENIKRLLTGTERIFKTKN